MVNENLLSESERKRGGVINELRHRGWSWKTCGAALGLGGGILCPIFGSIFTATTWISGATWHGLPLQRIGTVLLALTIPLLIFGGHCLDLIDKDEKRS